MKRISSFIIGSLFIFLIIFTLVSDPSSLPKIFDLSEGEVLSESISLFNKKPAIDLTSREKQTTRVTRVIDGDTIEIEGGHKVRYIGIDTPESEHPQKPVECFAREATQRNKELVEGKEVTLERDVRNTDRYDRLLRYVYVDEKMVNRQLVLEGFAQASAYPPDVKYQESFDSAQFQAIQENAGLWGDVCLES